MGNNLAKLRGKHQISQTALANQIGVTKQALCFAEKGNCSFTMAKKVSDALDENIFDVLGTDALTCLPRNEQEKEKLIEMIQNIEVR